MSSNNKMYTQNVNVTLLYSTLLTLRLRWVMASVNGSRFASTLT